MGINGLSKFIKDKIPSSIMLLDITTLKGNKVAIDAALFLNKYAFSAHNSLLSEMASPADDYDPAFFTVRLKDLFLTFLMNFITRGITPIVIFDGPSDPEKQKCQAKRSTLKESLKDKVDRELAEYKSKDSFELTSKDDIALLKTRGQYYKIKKSDFQYIETMLNDIGIPNFRAPHDGEKLCAALSLEKLVSAVCTNDSDSQPLGTGIMISEVNFRGMSKMTYLAPILQYIGTEFGSRSYEESLFYFRELCIMCGCDFNENIKNVGPSNALKLLKAHRNIEAISQVKDITCLNHNHCRNFFNYNPSNISEGELYIDWNKFDPNISLYKPKTDMYFDMNLQKINRTFLERTKITFKDGI